MTTDNNPNPDPLPTSQLSSEQELAAAFGAKSTASQQGSQQQNQQESEGGSSSSGSSSERTAPSSTATTPPEDVLAGKTLEELLAHPTLGPLVQSHADKVAATKLTGVTDKVRRETLLEINRARFEAMDQEDLGELLSKDKEAAKAYAEVQATPPPPSPDALATSEVGQAVSFFTTGIRTTQAMIAGSGLPEATKASLAPEKHLVAADHPGKSAEEIYAAWQLLVTNSITDHRIKSVTASLEESADLNNQAKADESSASKGALMTSGSNTSPLPDLMTTRSEVLLADAFARQAVSPRR